MSLLLLGGTKVVAGGGGVEPFFEDSFAGGQLNPYGGFVYSSDRGAISGLTVVGAGSPGAVVKDGFTHSLQGTYSASALGGQNGSPQLNFSWDEQVNELWFDWELHVPLNYFHRNNYLPGSPITPMTDNNKWWMFWSTEYSNGYHQVACELTQNNAIADQTANGTSVSRPLMRSTTSGSYTDIGGIAQTIIGPSAPIVPGTWNNIKGHIRKASAIGVSDGIWSMLINGVAAGYASGLAIGASDPSKFAAGLDQGYFLGYANSGFNEDTTFHTQWLKFFRQNPGW